MTAIGCEGQKCDFGVTVVPFTSAGLECVYVCAKSLQLCPSLCDPMDCSLLCSSIHGLLQARLPQWVAMPSSRGSSQPRDLTCVSYVSFIGRQVLCHQHNYIGHTQIIHENLISKSLTKPHRHLPF